MVLTTLIPFGVVALLVLANALYVAAEFGAVGVRRSRVRRLAEDGHIRASRLLPYIEDPAALVRYLSATQVGITLASLTLGAYAEHRFSGSVEGALAGRFGLDEIAAHSTAAVLILVGLTAVQLVGGELVPKSVALQHPTETALITIVPMRWSLALFSPFSAVLNITSRIVLRLFGSSDASHRHIHSPEEIELLIAESRDGGLLEPDEHRRLRRALRLGLRTARDLMVPIARVTRLRVDAPWDETVRVVTSTPFSRLPVYRGESDRIVGTLRVTDLAAAFAAGEAGRKPARGSGLSDAEGLEKWIRPVVGVREEMAADRIVTLLRERRSHQAIVVDADGRALGLLTIQDILNELLGAPPPTRPA